VDTSGLVTGEGAGITAIKATTVDGGKTAICTVMVSENSTVSVRNNTRLLPSGKDMLVYPNPVSSQLSVVLGDEFAADASIQLFDHTGRLLLSLRPTGTENTIDMGSLSPGLYLIKVFSAGKWMVQPIIKK
jgi:hypothetical protein